MQKEIASGTGAVRVTAGVLQGRLRKVRAPQGKALDNTQ